MINGIHQCHMEAGCTQHLPFIVSELLNKSHTKPKVYFSSKYFGEYFGEKSRENGPFAEQWQDRKSKMTRQREKKSAQDIGNGNQMRSPRFQTSDIPGLHWGDSEERGDNPKLSVAPYVWSKSEYISQCEWAGRGADQNRHHMVTGKNEEQIRTDILWWHGRKSGRSILTSHGDREGRGADQNTHHIIFRLLLSV